MSIERHYYVAGGATYRTIIDPEAPDYMTRTRSYVARGGQWVDEPRVTFRVSEADVTEVDAATALARVAPDELDRA